MKQALLVIDVQVALCQGEYAAFDAQGLVGRVNAVASAARVAQAPVIFVQHESKGPLLRHGSAGWQLAQGLHAVDGDDYFVRKTTPDSFLHTDLEALLTTAQISAHHTKTLTSISSFAAQAVAMPAAQVAFKAA